MTFRGAGPSIISFLLLVSAPALAEDGGAPEVVCVAGFDLCPDKITLCCRDSFYCSGDKDGSVCVALRQTCADGGECESGQCVNGFCKCRSDDECEAPSRCDPATGQCLPGCSDVNPCDKEVCAPPGVCVPGCSSDTDCDANRICLLEYVDRDGNGGQAPLWIGQCESQGAQAQPPAFQCAVDDVGSKVGGALVWLSLAGAAFFRAGKRWRSGG